jgi:hypothetical protein
LNYNSNTDNYNNKGIEYLFQTEHKENKEKSNQKIQITFSSRVKPNKGSQAD